MIVHGVIITHSYINFDVVSRCYVQPQHGDTVSRDDPLKQWLTGAQKAPRSPAQSELLVEHKHHNFTLTGVIKTVHTNTLIAGQHTKRGFALAQDNKLQILRFQL
jgi:hypothetical protein